MKTRNFPTETGGEGGTLREAITSGATRLQQSGNKNPARDAQLLLLQVTGHSRTDLILRPEQTLTREQERSYHELINRRAAHEPIQYITGEREFYGLRFHVTPDVLIPRPETEHLVEAALERIPLNTPSRIADVGTGSGVIAIALAVSRPSAKITAIDISPQALQVAKQNASAHHVSERIDFLEANLLEGFEPSSLDMIVSNPPYIASGERETLDAEVRDYEPAQALFAGPTGLEIYEDLIPQAASALRRGGWLLMEIGAGQQLSLSQLLKGWTSIRFLADLQGIPRVVLAQRA